MFNLKIVASAAVAIFFLAIPSEAATLKKRTHYTQTTKCTNIECLIKQKRATKVATKPATHTTKKTTTTKKKYVAKKKTSVKKKPYVNAQAPKIENRLISKFNRGVYTNAAKYVGLSERGHTRTLQNLTGVNPRHTPWCAAFLNSVLKKSGHKTTGSHAAASFRNYGKAVKQPAVGDIVVLNRHVGIFAGYVNRNGKRYVAVLGGNQSNRVQISYYPAKRVVAYRRPA